MATRENFGKWIPCFSLSATTLSQSIWFHNLHATTGSNFWPLCSTHAVRHFQAGSAQIAILPPPYLWLNWNYFVPRSTPAGSPEETDLDRQAWGADDAALLDFCCQCVCRCWHQDRPHPVSGRQAGGTGAWSCRSAAGDLHRAGDLLLPPQASARCQDGRRQKRSQGWWCLQLSPLALFSSCIVCVSQIEYLVLLFICFVCICVWGWYIIISMMSLDKRWASIPVLPSHSTGSNEF